VSVAIVSYGMRNLRSIYNACKAVGADPVIAETHQQIADASAVILPGVGAFGQGVELLREFGCVE
jgi:imidazole glycerol-phosphate synthase subunit HisH